MRTSITWAGVSDSENEVNPRRSVNMIVPSRWMPPSRSPSALLSTSSTTSSGTNRANRSTVRIRSNASVMSCTASAPIALRTSAPSGYTNDTTQPPLNMSWTKIANTMPSATAIPIEIRGRTQMLASGTATPSTMISRTSTQPGAEDSGNPFSTVLIALAWTSGPGIAGSVGVGWMSSRTGVVAPITTILPV